MQVQPTLIKGGLHSDERGDLYYFNELNLDTIKRMYLITHPTTDIVRAWQAHKREQKWFKVVSGAFKIVVVQPDNWKTPSEPLATTVFILKAKNHEILHIPGNFANGFKALEPNSELMVFSDFTVAESAEDNFRYPAELWYNWNTV